MSDEIELISDGAGLAVIGEPSAVERFLRARGLLTFTEDLGLHRLGALAQAVDGIAGGASEIAANSGRWLKLTEESAAVVQEFGLMETKTAGISHAMVGDPGSISKWLQIDTSRGAVLTNPAMLAGAAGIMAQLARQAEIREIKAYLQRIDEKIDDVRRGQRDAVLARMDGVALAIEEGLTVREHGGHLATVWSKVQTAAGSIAETQAHALRALAAHAEKLEEKAKIGDVAKAVRAAEDDVAVWLAVLARCFELHEAIAVLELDRVAQAAPDELDGHRLGLAVAREKRRELILEHTARLMNRLEAAADDANLNVLLHLPAARAIVGAVNQVGAAVDDFREPLSIEPVRDQIETTRWREAIRDAEQWKAAAMEAGPKAVAGAAVVGAGVLVVIPQTRGFASGVLKSALRTLR
ncbi:hypothetical protein FLP10_11420 [Agromyces intestinalis]|uniref:Uncharacterized protein n=1 Tax=Agromyces intestinalis TaxID=2592652 RepID=A0A5C1YIL5_9MICO|nr:hypothetical protein [Agromyces intestinalis]QEO14959.1 hypothetical protein FLP10_11420 [Agromyces intestinalis]